MITSNSTAFSIRVLLTGVTVEQLMAFLRQMQDEHLAKKRRLEGRFAPQGEHDDYSLQFCML
jgi:hypothetical protein